MGKRREPVQSEKEEPKRPRISAAAALLSNVITINDSSGNRIGYMQQVPVDPSLPLTDDLLKKFGFSDDDLREKFMFYFTYTLGYSEGPVKEGLLQLVHGMHKSVETHITATNHLINANANYASITNEYNSVLAQNESLRQKVYELSNVQCPVIARLESELASAQLALDKAIDKAASDNAALELEISLLEKRHQSELNETIIEKNSLAIQIDGLRKENRAFSSIDDRIKSEISKIRVFVSEFAVRMNADISEISSQFSEFQTLQNVEHANVLSELSILRGRSNR